VDPVRIFITGASGFVGRHLVAHLRETLGDRVLIFAAVHSGSARPAAVAPVAGWSGEAGPNVTIEPCDIEDAAQVSTAIADARPARIVHLAARSSGADRDRDAVLAVNVEGTRNVLEAASKLTPFPRTLVASTGYVYGNTDPARPAREDDPIGPLWRYGPYTDSKIEMESVARNYRAFTIIARPFSHTGPGQSPTFALSSFARQLARIERGLSRPVLLTGDLTARRDVLDVRDVVRAYSGLLESGLPGAVYNVATGAPRAIGELLDILRGLCRVETAVEVDATRLRPAEIACSTGDPLCLWGTTGWSPRISVDTTLRDLLEYWRDAPDDE
jgi:GDP-4-dehydro-6-deoxy-D-mannose reductase